MTAGGGGRLQALGTALRRWVDSHAGIAEHEAGGPLRVDWLRVAPFLGLHLACLAVIWVGWSWFSVAAALALYLVRMFSITGFYHRYFSHRTFKTTRAGQFAFALLGMTSVQRGPLWWAAHHRHHHAHADEDQDAHSPRRHGMLWAHVGWITARANFPTRLRLVPDLAKFPELRFLDRFDVLVPVLFAAALFGLGAALAAWAPGLGVTGPQLLVWGFCISTVALLHGTFTINSLAHRIGRRRYPTKDDSRNSWLLALITLGEGWHNNHHRYPAAARQGFYWWELDPTYYGLLVLKWLGVIWDLKPVPARVRESWRTERAAA